MVNQGIIFPKKVWKFTENKEKRFIDSHERLCPDPEG